MANRNLYLTYKKDTSRLLFWVINTSNGIIQAGQRGDEDDQLIINTTGRSTVAEIISMCQLIAKNLKPIPSAILGLFRAVIKARSAMYAVFQQIVSKYPDPDIERRNATHKHFIDALSEALKALGGDTNDPEQQSALGQEGNGEDSNRFLNNFSALSLGEAQEDDDSSEDETHGLQKGPQKKSNGRGKKGKKGKKGKRGPKSKQKSAPGHNARPAIAEIPMESYRIIEDRDGLVSDYLLAVYAVVKEWMALRSFTQDLWREVAYEGLNGAVASSLTSTAVAMVKQTCMAVFADFPGHESYDTIIQTITRGDLDKAHSQFTLGLYRISDCGHQQEKVQETKMDSKEQLWVHAYNDLVAFVCDFQKNRTGKPTKAMQAQLTDWSPTFDLQRATNEERVKWRRAYTINWLYDLVNLFSSIVVQRNTMKGEHHVFEEVDWSMTGPWNHHRRLFGLQEFAGIVTSLAMQKQNTDVRKRILPHHVFQLQCIVDSFVASRGWTLSPLRGHILAPPPRKFRPRRDVDLFLDREVKRDGQGILQSIDVLKQLWEKDASANQEPNRHTTRIGLLDDLQFDFVNWLGESKYMYGLTTIPPSRFSKHNANGLWEYSPALCAAGLIEGIILVQRLMMKIWDDIPEPTLILHLHNMLVQKGYLKQVGLYATLESLLQDSFFPNGIPTEGFSDALFAWMAQKRKDPDLLRQRQALGQDMAKDIHEVLDPRLNHFFKEKSVLMMFYDAEWIPEHVPDSVIKVPTMLSMLRLRKSERAYDPITNTERLKETELVKRAKAQGQTDEQLLELASVSVPNMYARDVDAAAILRDDPKFKGYTNGPHRNPYHVVEEENGDQLQGRALLDFLRLDMFADVCGSNPVSSMNYVWVTCHMMLLFLKIEDIFKKARHPLWVSTYEDPQPQMRRHKRFALAVAAMSNEDDRAMKLFAQAFDELRLGAMACIYWENLREEESGVKLDGGVDEMPGDQCSVM